ncbi:hypothetical protein [Rhizobium rhizogenes]|uniref:hypothetical protein n=1 Tax=Rhizobium rhizogenes TaxID=359 RepID=UPI0015721A11|nr:hypothetical protein [Rhizobium rhizogenes]NTF64953.1 hypothetical protein [Rhizobium rhizogenes]NTG96301.1 hypothetical protein [Rhizobium rhizogenes]
MTNHRSPEELEKNDDGDGESSTSGSGSSSSGGEAAGNNFFPKPPFGIKKPTQKATQKPKVETQHQAEPVSSYPREYLLRNKFKIVQCGPELFELFDPEGKSLGFYNTLEDARRAADRANGSDIDESAEPTGPKI